MNEKKVVKTVRLSTKDEALIESFIESNPGLDFSTLIRLALYKFIKDPSLEKPKNMPHKIKETSKEFH